MTGMIRVVQRNCNITGEIPSYFWTMKDLDMLDLSFNNLFGEIPARAHVGHLRFLFLTGNKLMDENTSNSTQYNLVNNHSCSNQSKAFVVGYKE